MFYSPQQNKVIFHGSAVGDDQLEFSLNLAFDWWFTMGPLVHNSGSIGKYTATLPGDAVAASAQAYLMMRNPYDRVYKAYEEYCIANGVVAWSTWFGSTDYTGSYLDPLTTQFPTYDDVIRIEQIDVDFDSFGIYPTITSAWVDPPMAVVLPVAEVPSSDKPAVAARYSADFSAGGYTP